MTEKEYGFLKKKIAQLLDIDIEAYKSGQMRRRLESFVGRRDDGDPVRFAHRLESDADCLRELRDMLTINVSEFNRDTAQFERLKTEALPELLRGAARINIWSAGCSNGQEPYSLAIILAELLAGHRANILATDLDREALKRAKAGGPYRDADVRGLPQEHLEKYFSRSDDGYTVNDQIRRRVEFRELNLLTDQFDRGFDLLVCRNVMIYFSDETKRMLFEKFHRSLNPNGILFVGGTEALFGSDGIGFERIAGNFYRRADVVASDQPQEKAA